MAHKISDSMFFLKRVFPIAWGVFLVVIVGIALTSTISSGAQPAEYLFFLVPVFVAVIGYTVMRRLIWDLVDEVYDHGDYLVVKNRGDETRIDLADIINVSVTTMMNPPRITLRLRQPTRLGSEVAFSPAGGFRWFPAVTAKNAIAEDLILRVDRARSQRR